jgi:hypothetical protein
MYDGADPSFDADLLHRTPALSSSQVWESPHQHRMATLVWKSRSSAFDSWWECDALNAIVRRVVSGDRSEVMMMIECEFVFDVYWSCPNDYSLSAIDDECVSAVCETIVWDCSDSDGGYSIGCRYGDHLKQSAATSRSFEWDSNVIDVSDWQL